MDTYDEYPVRCHTCNEQLACYVSDYKGLMSSGVTSEQALTDLGITNWCSRIAMQNPTIVAFDMENREVIEGFKSVENAEIDTAQNESPFTPIFSACLGEIAIQESIRPVRTEGFRGSVPSIRPLSGFDTNTRSITRPKSLLPGLLSNTPINVSSGSQGDIPISSQLGDISLMMGESIDVNMSNLGEFEYPIIVGNPTINHDSTLVEQIVNVGANKQVKILNGRTYLAQ